MVILADQGCNSIDARLRSLSLSALQMKLWSCGMVKMWSMKNHMLRLWSLGVLIRATRSSKYSLTPLNAKYVTVGRTVRVGGSEFIWGARGYWNPMKSSSRLSNAARQLTIISGEMYPARG